MPLHYWFVRAVDGSLATVEGWSAGAAQAAGQDVLGCYSWDVVEIVRGAHVLVCEVVGCGRRLTPGDSWSAGRCCGHAHWSDEGAAEVADAEYEVRS